MKINPDYCLEMQKMYINSEDSRFHLVRPTYCKGYVVPLAPSFAYSSLLLDGSEHRTTKASIKNYSVSTNSSILSPRMDPKRKAFSLLIPTRRWYLSPKLSLSWPFSLFFLLPSVNVELISSHFFAIRRMCWRYMEPRQWRPENSTVPPDIFGYFREMMVWHSICIVGTPQSGREIDFHPYTFEIGNISRMSSPFCLIIVQTSFAQKDEDLLNQNSQLQQSRTL